MRRPLFLCLIGLVLGEAAAISMGWKKGLILVLFFLLAVYMIKHLSITKQNLFFILKWNSVFQVVLYSFLTGFFLFCFAQDSSRNTICERTESIQGTALGRITDLKINNEGNYDIIVDKMSFREDKCEKKDFFSIKGKCRITGIKKEKEKLYPDDFILCRGTLREIDGPTNPGEFDSRTYYLARGIVVQMFGENCTVIRRTKISLRKAAYCLKEKIASVYRTVMTKEQAALLQAMILGEKGDLDDKQRTLYEENGVAHLLAVSGLHISIVGGKVFQLMRGRGVSYGISCLGGGGLLLFYGCVTGFGSSVIRAVLMYLFYLGAEFFGAGYDLVSAMSLSGILMLVEHPWRIMEGGFQISFLSVLAIGLAIPWVKALSEKKENKEDGELTSVPKWLERAKEGLVSSLIISGVTLPFMLRHFYEWSPYSILLNLLVIPAMTPLMFGGLLCGLTGILSLRAADFFGIVPGGILSVFQWLFQEIRRIPGSLLVTGCPSVLQMMGIYLLEISLFLCWYYRRWWKMAGIVIVMVCVCCYRTSSSLLITMLDVGQGDGIFFRFPDGTNILLDGGSSSRSEVGKYVLLPAVKYYGASTLDYVIITHMDEDHISGIKEILEQNYPVKHLILPESDQSDEEKESFCKLAEDKNIKVAYMKRGENLSLGEVKMICLHPFQGFSSKDSNASSLVFYLKYRMFDGLFTGDLEETGEEPLCEYLKKNKSKYLNHISGMEVLKVAHHGSGYSTKKELLDLICPKTALISVGKNNRYGHPHPELLNRLREIHCEVLQTSYEGAIEIRTDGDTWEIQSRWAQGENDE